MTEMALTETLGDELIEALHGEFTPKFLATQDASGKPNVVPIISLDAYDGRTLIFGELLIWKTRENLSADSRVAVAVVTEDLRVWTVRGRFREFVTTGPHVETMNAKEIFRYNAYVRISRVAVIDVEAVTGAWRFTKLGVAAALLQSKAAARHAGRQGGKMLPKRVAEKFARTQSVKVLAFQDATGHPTVLPALSLVPSRSDVMVFGLRGIERPMRDLKTGSPIAASVITMDPVAYQVKGAFAGERRTPLGRVGQLLVQEVYSASPPLSGERIDLRDPAG